MAEEEELVVAPDHKRKLEDLELEAEPVAELDATAVEDGVTEADGSESKRARLDEENEKPDGSASANGIKEEKSCGAVRENAEEAIEGTTIEVLETVEMKTDQVSSVDEHMSSDNQHISTTEETKEVLISTKEETVYGSIDVKEETKEVTITEGETEKEPLQEIDNSKLDEPSTDDSLTITRRVEVPNNNHNMLDMDDAEMLRARDYMRDRIFALLLHRQTQPLDETERMKFRDNSNRLAKGLFKTAHTKEDYMNEETLEPRLSSLIKGRSGNQHHQQLVDSTSSNGGIQRA